MGHTNRAARGGARLGRALAALTIVGALLLPALPAAAAEGDDRLLRVGTTQDLDAMNPFETALVIGFEVFTLNYELLVAFGGQLEPAPGYATEWTVNSAGTEYTFKIPEGKLWSDGEPATSEDARWTFQLILDAVASEAGSLCLGYIDPYLVNAGVTEVAAPDPQTLVVTLERPNDRILQTYVPILPKHIWESQTIESICEDQFETPIVGSGPFQAQEWQTGQSVRFAANPNWTASELAMSEIILQFFDNEDTMTQALANDELDYAQGILSDQFDQLQGEENIATVAGTANGFTELGFNTYGTGPTPDTIEGGGPSTPALLDPAFRDALGYAIDKEALVDRVLGGYGEPGTTQVPPFQTRWHKEPATARTFDIAQAGQKLEAAGYALDSQGRRLDKEGNPIVLDLVFPDSDTTYPETAEFITEWWAELGIVVNAAEYDSDTLIDLMLPPEADGTADYDLFIWGWAGDVDPNSLLEIFTCGQIGNSSDSNYCNPEYDELFEEQNLAADPAERKALIDEMQEIVYNEAPYHVLYYDAALHAYRTDKFTNWVNQPDNGTPLFGYGPHGYLQLRLASEGEPSASPGASQPTASGPVASGPAATSAPGGSEQPANALTSNPVLLAAILGLVAVAVVAIFLMRRRRRPVVEDE